MQPGSCWVGIDPRYEGVYVVAIYSEDGNREAVERAAREVGVRNPTARNYETTCFD